jgi:Carboxypeptidase regulatory-like domain
VPRAITLSSADSDPGRGHRDTAGAPVARCPVALAASLAAALLLCGCGGGSSEPPPPPPGAIPAGQAIGTAGISGRVLFNGTPPARKPIKMSGEASCHRPGGAEALSEEVIVNPDGTLRNVFVHVVSGLGDRVFAPPAEPRVMDQAGCLFVPHILAAQANQVLVFKNSDPAVHNVRAIAKENRTFNISMSGQGRTARRFFAKPELVRIRCDIHAWMGAFIAVDGSPFHAVTGDAGSFSLEGLPPGEYVVEAWHETLGSARQTVTLAEGEHRPIEFAFGR